MKLVFGSTLAKVNLTYMDKAGNSGVMGFYRYWKPKKTIELPIWKYFAGRFSRICKSKERWNKILEENNVNVVDNYKVINASALNLSKFIPEKSVDYIYTDPPYGGNIAYLDLSTMWNAWLGFEVSAEMKKDEIIEGGDLQKTEKNYSELFSQTFEEMGKVLKKNAWLSCVFAHKKLEFWNVIVDSCEENGMELKGSTFQPTNNSSMHFKKNPGNVLCSQRIANFQKTFEKSVREKPDDLQKFILNEMERICLEKQGASIDDIYQRVVERLLFVKSFNEAKKRGYTKDLSPFLASEKLFTFDAESNLYFVKKPTPEQAEYVREYFKHRDELRLCLTELLQKFSKEIEIGKNNIGISFDEIHKELFAIFQEDKRFPLHKNLSEILFDIGMRSKKTGKWFFRQQQTQSILNMGNVLSEKLVKIKTNGSPHSEMIFRLVQIGKFLGFNSWIGKREQSVDSFMGVKFSELSLPVFPMQVDEIKKSQLEKVKQIDVIWFDKDNIPRYAFEVEQSTNIITGFERFAKLLDFQHETANHLFIVAPESRKKKIFDVFKTSTYVGYPLFLENKIKLIYFDSLKKFYDSRINIDFVEEEFQNISVEMK